MRTTFVLLRNDFLYFEIQWKCLSLHPKNTIWEMPKTPIKTTAAEALQAVQSGNNVYIHGAAATPSVLVKALVDRSPELHGVELFHIHTEGEARYADPEMEGIFNVNAMFIGANVRKAIHEGRGSYIPVFLSETPLLFRRGIIPLDVALVSVSPPDQHGYCSLGVSVDNARAATECAKIVIAQVNRHMPRTFGDGLIHINQLDYLVEADVPLPTMESHEITETELRIGENVASLVDDRATLQMGIGGIPNAVLRCLGNHKDLGIHSEMFSDGILPLVEKGIITGKYKGSFRGRIVGSFLTGSQKLFDFVDNNPGVSMLDCQYVNDPQVIRKQTRMTAINSAIEIDLTGQVCADSIGTYMYSGVGGQMDFIRGAAISENGKPIIALPSVTRKGVSRIVPWLKQGAGVVTTRAHVHYIVTEWGIANLYGKPLWKRSLELIRIAHPDHREELLREARNMFHHREVAGHSI